jgi:predicted nuclease of restriction endonuclease-like (RecB) superfamily
MLRKPKSSDHTPVRVGRYDAILAEVVDLLETARRTSARAVNAIIATTYWQIGRRIVESEQAGSLRAEYGAKLLQRLSSDLTDRFGRGFSVDNLELMRRFYAAYPPAVISETASRKLGSNKSETTSRISVPGIFQTESGKSAASHQAPASVPFPLPWSHYVRLLSLDNPLARSFYETEALRGGWTVKQLERQINSSFYERTALSRNKVAMLTKHNRRQPEDQITAEEEVKDPLVLEFLGLKDEYSESELEEALILKLEAFLLELGNDFTFVGRQRRLRIGDTWYRVDLLLFHRRLRCLVIIDLKTGKFTHADAGQMHLYCNYAKKHWTNDDENPPVGLILCTQKNDAVAHYSLDGLPNKVMAAQYRTTLPDEKLIATELEKTRKMLESRNPPQRGAQ